jgi:Na+-driven multidrug efflux pump
VLVTFLSIGIPGGAMMAAEQAAFDGTTALASQLGQVATSAHAILLGLCTLSFIAFPFGLSIATSIR